MGRGRGGYTSIQSTYKDSGGRKVTDSGTIFVAERYIDMGYEAVFRQRHDEKNEKTYDLSIKTSNDEDFIKNILFNTYSSRLPCVVTANQLSSGIPSNAHASVSTSPYPALGTTSG